MIAVSRSPEDAHRPGLRGAIWWLWLGVSVLHGCGDGAHTGEARDAGASEGGLPWDQGGEDLPEYSLGRLLVLDAASSRLSVLDLDTGEVVGSVEASAGSQMLTGESGRYSYVYEPTLELLRVLDPGKWLLSHIDHFHIAASDLGFREEAVAVRTLSSLTSGEGWIVGFDAMEGKVSFFQERAITAGQFAPSMVSTVPHAGIASVHRGHVLFSDEDAEGLHIRAVPVANPNSEGVRVHACDDPRSIASNGERVFVGCGEGLLVIAFSEADESFRASTLDLGQNASVTRVRAARGLAQGVVELGARALGVTDGEVPIEAITFENDVVDFMVRRQGDRLLVLTVDGVLHEVELPSLARGRNLQVLEPDLLRSDGVPSMALSHAYAYLAHAGDPQVVAVRLRSFEIEEKFAVGGAPARIALSALPAAYTDMRE